MTLTAAASIIGWSDDLLPKILVHFPVKTLLRLKVVCKKWKLIISDAQFALNQFRKTYTSSVSHTPCGLFLYHKQWCPKTISFPLFENPPGSVPPLTINEFPLDIPDCHRYFQSCNGLLLCVYFDDYFMDDASSRLAICNPTTGDIKVLPNPPDLGTCRYDGLTLVFNPFESHHYSVVAIKIPCRANKPMCGACYLYNFSSETGRWEFRRVIDDVEMYESHTGWFSDDTIYWIGTKLMHYYNLNSQEVGRLDMPSEITANIRTWDNLYFPAGGHLYIVRHERFDEVKKEFKIFKFDNENMQWSNPHIELLSSDHFENNEVPSNTTPVAVVRGKDESDFLLVFAAVHPPSFMVVDLVQHKLVQTHAVEDSVCLRSCDYIPSLVHI